MVSLALCVVWLLTASTVRFGAEAPEQHKKLWEPLTGRGKGAVLPQKCPETVTASVTSFCLPRDHFHRDLNSPWPTVWQPEGPSQPQRGTLDGMKLEGGQSEVQTLNSAGAEHYVVTPRLQTRLSIPHSSRLARTAAGPALGSLSGCPGIKGRGVNKRED